MSQIETRFLFICFLPGWPTPTKTTQQDLSHTINCALFSSSSWCTHTHTHTSVACLINEREGSGQAHCHLSFFKTLDNDAQHPPHTQKKRIHPTRAQKQKELSWPTLFHHQLKRVAPDQEVGPAACDRDQPEVTDGEKLSGHKSSRHSSSGNTLRI